MSTIPVRPPQQERSRRSLERVLIAGAELLRERGYDGFAIAEVCARARVSAGALYGRFSGKDALILAIHEHSMRRVSQEAVEIYDDDARWQGLDIAGIIEHAVTVLLDHFAAHAGLLKVFILRSAIDEQMQRQGAAAVGFVANAFTARLLPRAAEIPHPDPEAAIRACFAIAFEAASWNVAFGDTFDAVLGEAAGTSQQRLPVICRLYLLDSA